MDKIVAQKFNKDGTVSKSKANQKFFETAAKAANWAVSKGLSVSKNSANVCIHEVLNGKSWTGNNRYSAWGYKFSNI